MTISVQANDVRGTAKQSVVGRSVFSSGQGTIERLTAANEDPQAVQIDTVTVDSAVDDTLYTYEINGITVQIDSGTGATTTTIAAALAAQHDSLPLVRGVVAAVPVAAVITLTGLIEGNSYALTESDTRLTAASVQAAAAADAVPFGRLVVDDGLETGGAGEQLGRLAKSTAFTAQVHTLEILFVASSTVTVTVRDAAGDVLAQADDVDADTNTDTTADAIRDALNGLLPANSVIVSSPGGGSGDVVFTAELAGLQFSVEVGTNEEGEAGGAIVGQTNTTGPSATTSMNLAALGISEFSINDPTTTIGGLTGEYAPNARMRVLKRAAVWVERPSTGVSPGDQVFVELAVGDDSGKFFNADSATRARLLNAEWERDGRDSTDGLAAVRIRLGL